MAKQIAKDEDKRYYNLMEDAYEMRTRADYLIEDVDQNELDQDFQRKAQDMRDHFEKLTQSA